MSSATIKDLLSNNEVPSGGIIKEIQDMRQEYQRDLEKLDIEVQNISKQLNDVSARQAEVQAKMSQNDIILSPIRRVPAYIFYQVFQYCLPPHRNSIPRQDDPPLSLTHVCRAWRNTALSSPRLWTQIHIGFTEDQTTLEESLLQGKNYYDGVTKERVAQILCTRYDGVKEWLSRSEGLPLSISLNFSLKRGSTTSLNEDSLSKITLQLFALIKSVSHRLVNLEFTGPPEIYTLLESTFSDAETKVLTALKIRPIHDGPSATLERRLIKLLKVPNLKEISFAGDVCPFWEVPTSSVRWEKFTDISLHYGGLSMTMVDSLLRKCSNLIHFLAVIGPNKIVPPGGPIYLPFLVALSIEERIAPECMRVIYERIDAPALKWVNYASYPLGTIRRQTNLDRTIPIIQLLQKSRDLKKLTFDGADYSPSVMRELYQSVPGITVLSIGKETRPGGKGYERDSMATSTLRKITWGQEDTWNIGALVIDSKADDLNNDSILLPRLEKLDIFSLEGDVPDWVLRNFIESRAVVSISQKIPALKEVRVEFSQYKSVAIDISLLNLHIVAGVRVKIYIGGRARLRQFLADHCAIMDAPAASSSSHLFTRFPGLLSVARQMDDYGRTWNQLDVSEHMKFMNSTF